MMPRQLFVPARAMHEESEGASDSTIKAPPPFILPPEAEQKLGENPEILQVIFKALESVRTSFIERNCIPPDDFEILLLLTYGLKAKDVKALTRVQCIELEYMIRQRQNSGNQTEAITKDVRSFLRKKTISIPYVSESSDDLDRKLEKITPPPFGSRLSSHGQEAWFLHSFRKFAESGLPIFLVYTDDGAIEEWSPRFVEMKEGTNKNVHQKVYPINAEVQLVRAMVSLGFSRGGAKIIDSKLENGVLKILVRHLDDMKNDHGDLIEDWITPDKISYVL